MRTMRWRLGLSTLLLLCTLCALPAAGQQTGSIYGRVTLADGAGLPGVTVEATSPVLPQARTTVTAGAGEYRLPLLPPGDYQVRFVLEGMAPVARSVAVRLDQNVEIDITLGPEGVSETIDVIAEAPLVDRGSAETKTAITDDVIDSLPVGQDYRDLPEADPRRPVHRGQPARPERRRQRPGQRLQVRRRQRHAAAVRHALLGALVARHRPGGGGHAAAPRRSTSTARAASPSTR